VIVDDGTKPDMPPPKVGAQDMTVMVAKFLIPTIYVNLLVTCGEGNINLPTLSLSKFLLLANHHTISWPPPWI